MVLRFYLALMLLTLTLTRAAAPPEAHTFADSFGRTFSGTLLEATDTQAKVRREEGQEFKLELAKLSEADITYVAKWRRERQTFTLRIETSTNHTRVGSNLSKSPNTVDQNIAASYDIKVTNATSTPVSGLRVEYNVFAMQNNYELYTVQIQNSNQPNTGPRGSGTPYVLDQRLRQTSPSVPIRIKGSAPLDLTAFKVTTPSRTTPLNYFKHSSTQTAANGNSLDYETGALLGLWVRVLTPEDKVVAEFFSSENLRAQGWQAVAAPGSPAPGG